MPKRRYKEVVVQIGDTLSHIAERELGRASAWRMLQHLNHLQNPHLIVPGQFIKVPMKEQP